MLMAYRIDVVTTVSSFLFPFQIFFKISFFLFGSWDWNAEQRRMSEEGENTIFTDSSRQQSSQVSSSQLVCGSCGGAAGNKASSFLELWIQFVMQQRSGDFSKSSALFQTKNLFHGLS